MAIHGGRAGNSSIFSVRNLWQESGNLSAEVQRGHSCGHFKGAVQVRTLGRIWGAGNSLVL